LIFCGVSLLSVSDILNIQSIAKRRPKIMPKKRVVKVVLSTEQKEILEELSKRLGTSESETLRMALMDYAKELSLMKERVRKQAKKP
jgi:predicted nucleic acid-binding protein